jgi:hypothetical protein
MVPASCVGRFPIPHSANNHARVKRRPPLHQTALALAAQLYQLRLCRLALPGSAPLSAAPLSRLGWLALPLQRGVAPAVARLRTLWRLPY